MSSPSSPPTSPPYSPSTPSIDSNPIHCVEAICCFDEALFHNDHNFARSDMPVRILFYMENKWHDFEGETLKSLCSGFTGGMTLLPLEIRGCLYNFDFLRMQQMNLYFGNWRSIAWIDVKGNYFFPKIFIDHDSSSSLSIDNIIIQDVANNKGKGDVLLEEISVNGCGGTKQNILTLTSEFPNAKKLMKNDPTFMYTIDLFFSNICKIDMQAVVTDIHELKISGSRVRACWDAFEKHIEMTEVVRGKANVVYAWYAAPTEKVASILSHGFELISNPPTMRPSLGAGIFLADLESPQHSGMQYKVDKDPLKHIILCQIVLGSVEKVELEFHQSCASRNEFDTGSDDPKNPKWYVVWANDINNRILPICVVTCKTSAIMPVDWGMFTYDTYLSPRVMLEIKKRIPIVKLPALQDIYDNYKNGRVAGNVYENQLQAIVGDQIFKDIMKDVYGAEL